jgi:hypothetical protein
MGFFVDLHIGCVSCHIAAFDAGHLGIGMTAVHLGMMGFVLFLGFEFHSADRTSDIYIVHIFHPLSNYSQIFNQDLQPSRRSPVGQN